MTTLIAHHPAAARMRYRPVRAETRVRRRPLGPAAYDCVRVGVITDGSAIIGDRSRLRPVVRGDAVLVAPNEYCRVEPEGSTTVTTVFLDSDYFADQVFWQYSNFLSDRLAAQAAMGTIYPEPIQIVRLGEKCLEALTPVLEELVELSQCATDRAANFFRVQALVAMLIDSMLPQILRRPPPVQSWNGARLLPAAPRWRQFRPLRRDALAVESLLRSDIARRWTLATLCEHVHLSSQQLVRVFVDAYGKTPHTYLAMLRVETMAKLLRETDIPVAQVIRQVGWNSRGHGADIFRLFVIKGVGGV